MFHVVPAVPADLPAAADVLTEAFEQDPVIGAFVPAGPHRSRRIATLFRALLASSRHGVVDLARRDDGTVVGAALWEPPARPAPVRGLLRQALQLPGFLAALGPVGTLRAARRQAALARHRPAAEHWYLGEIGVAAEGRGAGVGTALLQWRLAQVDARGEAAYLESSTPVNRRLYERHGFRVRAVIDGIPGASPAAMWRPAGLARPADASPGGRAATVGGTTRGPGAFSQAG